MPSGAEGAGSAALLTDLARSLVEAFLLGNAAILTNVCLLPLYPGLVAYLLGSREDADTRRPRRLRGAGLGLALLGGVLTTLVAITAALAAVRVPLAAVLPVLLPAAYVLVTALGAALLAGRNPFARLALPSARTSPRPVLAAFQYGLLLGPVTLPCTGPLVASAFVLGFSSLAYLSHGLAFAVAYGLGFGWPLVILAVLDETAGRRLSGWLGRRHALLVRLSGLLLVAIGLYGLAVEVLPNLS